MPSKSIPLVGEHQREQNDVSRPSEWEQKETCEGEKDVDYGRECGLEELKPTQKAVSGPIEVTQPRRSERIRAQQEKPEISGPITRSKSKKTSSEDITSLA